MASQVFAPEYTRCAATVAHNNHPIKPCYIESDNEISTEHLTLYHDLRVFVDDILQKKIPWRLTKLSSKLLQIVDHNDKHHHETYATDDMLQYLQQYATRNALVACCMGSNYDLDDAKQCILDIVQWRVCSKIDEITPMHFRNSLESKSVWSTHQYDKKGHPICHFKVLQTTPDDPWTIVRAAVFSIEKCIKLAEQRNVYQIMWFVDLEHLSYSTLPPVEVLLEISNLMTYYYPERLYKSYMLFTPWIFSAIFKAMTPYLPVRTQHKIVIPGWYESESLDTFRDDVDEGQLVKRFGGSNEAVYEYQWELQQFQREQLQRSMDQMAMEQGMEEEKAMEHVMENVVEDGDVVIEEEKGNEIVANPTDEVDGGNEMDHGNELEIEDEDDSKLCIVCLDGERDHVLIPCGHICVCGDCKECYTGDDAECPLCRAKVDMVIKTFH